MRLFVANWKMNQTRAQARAFVEELGKLLGSAPPAVELVVAPPLTALDAARDSAGRWSLAAQNLAAEASGAFTGEVSGSLLADAGCRYVLVGHYERRRLFGEDGPLLARKLARAREAGLIPIYCVGESEEERMRGATSSVLARQAEALSGDPTSSDLVVAYEPVWAIGTGRAATAADAGAARQEIGRLLGERRGARVLYGGSVTPENAGALLAASGMDGFLIGGASLDADSFACIAGISGRARAT
ncbi:MAG TPA: triose-phosphate isomerase [Thermoanaerobaculia bacterium]|nr:triose-phosphate isomerase [Thermoanaerobaculia bacterium]